MLSQLMVPRAVMAGAGQVGVTIAVKPLQADVIRGNRERCMLPRDTTVAMLIKKLAIE